MFRPESALHSSTGPSTGARVIAGGIVAHNDERRIERSIRSLLLQRLPDDTAWGKIWVVASGCTDRTVEIARSIADDDDRIAVLVERERRGKAAALGEVLRRAEGDSLILLNSDAIAAPGSVRALLAKAYDKPRPYAVMGRPRVPAAERSGGWVGSLGWMWELHHELHLEMLSDGAGGHLSDELLMVSLPAFPWIEDGIINDGSYCAVWLQSHRGGCWYAPDAAVAVDIPSSPRHHLTQRRRIHAGNAQVTARLGRAPTTVVRFLFEQPSRTLRSLRRALAADHGFQHLARMGALELAAHGLAAWDRLPPRRNHVLWERIEPARDGRTIPVATPEPVRGSADEIERRLRTLYSVAGEFGGTLTPENLTCLLPDSAPETAEGLERYLRDHPGVGGPNLISPGTEALPTSPASMEREARGIRFHRFAEHLVRGPLAPLSSWVQCIGVTGSTAYGQPEAADDLDFFVVTRRGALTTFLAATYLRLQLEQLRSRSPADPPVCFNYVVDAERAAADLAAGRGLLFAREALTARMILGDDYYRGLLAGAPGLAAELPRLYALRTGTPGDPRPLPAPLAVRIASVLLFAPLAAYLQLAGLWRNARFRATPGGAGEFRTVTRPDRVLFQSRRFEELRARYEGGAVPRTGRGGPSTLPTSR
jgi:poly-beta-1,6-N-acetyl-D-glucosamine synthase